MQLLWFALFLAVSNAAVLTTVPATDTDMDGSIRAPILVKLTAMDNYGFQIEWEPVKSDEANPNLGYKVKVWEQPKDTVYKYEKIDGAPVLVKEEDVPAKFPINEVPEFEPKQVLMTKSDVHVASSSGLQPGIVYEFRVQAYTSKGDGPLSAPMGLQFSTGNSDNKDMYTVA